MGRILFEPVLASNILDRFVHHCNFINITGDSYKMRERESLFQHTGKRGQARKIEVPDMVVGVDADENPEETGPV